jgi:hypothetical protein
MLVPERARKCVAFIGIKQGGQFRPRATAFLVEVEDQQGRWKYLVTAEHVISLLQNNCHEIWLRANERGDRPPWEEKVAPDSWWFGHRDRNGLLTDVAVAPIALNAESELDAVPINGQRSVAATRDVIESHKIGVGDEIAVSGLFRSHYGLQRNIPIVRIGNLAMLAAEPVMTRIGDVEAHLIEARSIGGLSGSPVFVNMAPFKMPATRDRPKVFHLYLLGLIHGHFDIKNLNDDVVVEQEQGATTGIHTGIGVVIPVEKIIETIFQPELVDIREQVAKES